MTTVSALDGGPRLIDYFIAPTRLRIEILYEDEEENAKHAIHMPQTHVIEIYGHRMSFEQYDEILRDNVYYAVAMEGHKKDTPIKPESLVLVYLYEERKRFFSKMWEPIKPRKSYEGPLRKKYFIYGHEITAATIFGPNLA